MHQQQRLQRIMEILEENGFVTVQYLTQQLHYSTATINRDLNLLQSQHRVQRSFGGAALAEEKTVPLHFRYSKMRPVKNKIGKKAAEFIQNGDTIFIDCSTTAQYIGHYITDRKDLTVITNNLSLAAYLSEYGIQCICLGGRIMEPPSMVYSQETVENVRRYGADKLFFSAGAVTPEGRIGQGQFGAHTLMIRAMMENATQRYLLVDHEKLQPRCQRYLGSLAEVDMVIADFAFPPETVENCPDTQFIQV